MSQTQVKTNKSNATLFKESLVNRCIESSANGLPNIFKTSNWFVKILWIFLFTAGCGAGLYCNLKFFFV